VLHITNGDSAAHKIERLRPPDTVLPWRDILHEGPVPAGLNLTELSSIRADYIAARLGRRRDSASALPGA
jgi:hypothetical protein